MSKDRLDGALGSPEGLELDDPKGPSQPKPFRDGFARSHVWVTEPQTSQTLLAASSRAPPATRSKHSHFPDIFPKPHSDKTTGTTPGSGSGSCSDSAPAAAESIPEHLCPADTKLHFLAPWQGCGEDKFIQIHGSPLIISTVTRQNEGGDLPLMRRNANSR